MPYPEHHVRRTPAVGDPSLLHARCVAWHTCAAHQCFASNAESGPSQPLDDMFFSYPDSIDWGFLLGKNIPGLTLESIRLAAE